MPVPVVPPVTAIQLTLLVAVQLQALAVVTAVVDAELPPAATLCDVGEIE